MANCEHCGNEYDKTFEIKYDGKTHIFDSFEWRSMSWRRNAIVAAAKSSVTVSKQMVRCFVAPTARVKLAKQRCAIAAKRPVVPRG